MKRKHVLAVGLLVVLVVVGGYGIYRLCLPNRAIVRNSSGVAVSSVVLILRDLDGGWSLQKTIPSLQPGENITVRHGKNDTSAELRYGIRGTSREHREAYIDLWRGEGWVFDVQSNGTVKSGYDYPRKG